MSQHLCSLRVGLVIALAVAGRFNTDAALLAYEGFDYPAGSTIAGQAGGGLWTNAWASGSTATSLGTNNATGLTYTDSNGRTLLTSGGSLVVGSPDGPSAFTATPNRVMNNNLSGGSGTTAGAGGTVWMSFLYQRLNLEAGGAPYFRQANLGLFEGTFDRLDIGGPNTSATVSNVFSVWGSGAHSGLAPFQSAEHPLLAGVTTFILVKIVTDGTAATDPAYVWFNPTNLTVEPSNATADLTDSELNLSAVNTLRFHAGGYNANGTNAAFQVDELRVGTTFTDVTPNAADEELPTILTDPEDLTVIEGQPASFQVSVSGEAPLHYRWYFNTNTPLSDATNSTYTIPSTVLADSGSYSVVVTNSGGAATSAVATLTVEAPVLPQITVEPADTTNYIGLQTSFSVSAIGTPPLRYQWYYNTNTPLPDKTNATMTFTVGSPTGAGGYSVVVTNNYGATTSRVAALTVLYGGPSILPAFPGADGAAKLVSGGRGGAVYHVTKLDKNLEDSSPGTLRYGLSGSVPSPKTIVFDVAGVFWLGRYGAESNHDNGWDVTSRYNWSGNTTIAGQTAPGPVIIMGGLTKAGAANTILRNVMIASGYGMRTFNEPPTPPTPGDFPDTYLYDGMDISGHDLMVDHVSVLYTTDEAISCNEVAYNLTIQNSVIAQGQNYPQNDPEGGAAYSWAGHALAHLLTAGNGARLSVLNNFYAHMTGRLPQVGDNYYNVGASNDFRNCVYYNWDSGGSSSGPSFNNFINNFHLAGPGGYGPQSRQSSNIVYKAGGTGIYSGNGHPAFVSGNLMDINKDGDYLDTTSANGSYSGVAPLSSALDVNLGLTLTAQQAFTNVFLHAGNHWWERDYDFRLNNGGAITTNTPADIANFINERLIHEAVTGTGNWIAWADDPFNSDPNEGTEWRALLALRADPYTGEAALTRPPGWDTDQDGMPDTWEIQHGLNPTVANNNADFDDDFYTDLEEYLNEVAAWPAPVPVFFTGDSSSRYAEIFNWQVIGQTINITGKGSVKTSSLWQPSRYDSAIISNRTAVVDAVGQHAGILQLVSNATLNITDGWLKIATRLENGAGCTATVTGPGTLTTSNLLNTGTLRLKGAASLSIGGTLTNTGTLDIMTWNGTLPGNLVNLGTILDRGLIMITDYEISGTDVLVTLQGYAGHQYRLQFRDGLTSGSWQDVGAPVAGADTPIQFTHANGAGSQQRLYRVVVD